MDLSTELGALFRRDLTRLLQELRAFPTGGTLWKQAPGVANSAGNLALHLEGNLREYIGRELGRIAYQRQRSLEFTPQGLPVEDVAARIENLLELIPKVVESLSAELWNAPYPLDVLGPGLSTRQFLISLHGHFNYHLGQIDYLRRILTNAAALPLATL